MVYVRETGLVYLILWGKAPNLYQKARSRKYEGIDVLMGGFIAILCWNIKDIWQWAFDKSLTVIILVKFKDCEFLGLRKVIDLIITWCS